MWTELGQGKSISRFGPNTSGFCERRIGVFGDCCEADDADDAGQGCGRTVIETVAHLVACSAPELSQRRS